MVRQHCDFSTARMALPPGHVQGAAAVDPSRNLEVSYGAEDWTRRWEWEVHDGEDRERPSQDPRRRDHQADEEVEVEVDNKGRGGLTPTTFIHAIRQIGQRLHG